MRALVTLLVLLCPRAAHADAYAWGGARGRVSVHVTVSGFHEGAGVGGWDVEHARLLAGWMARLEAMLPPGVRADVGNDDADGELVLALRTARGTETIALGVGRALPGAELDPVLETVARRFHVPVPPPATVRVYTVQLLAGSRAHAEAFARALDDAEATEIGGDFFWESCLPCSVPAAHVLDGDRGTARVVVGIHADRASARAAQEALRARGLRAFVRAL